MGVSVFWIPVLKSSAELWHYLNAVLSYLGAPVCALFIAAILIPRCNEVGAFWGLLVGLFFGGLRFSLEFLVARRSTCGDTKGDVNNEWWKDSTQWAAKVFEAIQEFHYLHFAVVLWAFSLFITLLISMLTPPIPKSSVWKFYYHIAALIDKTMIIYICAPTSPSNIMLKIIEL